KNGMNRHYRHNWHHHHKHRLSHESHYAGSHYVNILPAPSMVQHPDGILRQPDKPRHRTAHWPASTRLHVADHFAFQLVSVQLALYLSSVCPRHSGFLQSDDPIVALRTLTGTVSVLATRHDEFVLTRQSADHIQPDLFQF